MSWRQVRLDWVTTVSREVIDPALLGDTEVIHYSIPALDALGGPAVERANSIASAKLRVRGGEVLVSKLNPRKLRVTTVREHHQLAMASGEFIPLKPERIEAAFLSYWLQSEQTRQDLDGATQSVTRSHQRVTPDVLTKKWLMLPSAAAQRSIADFLDTETARIDALIAKKNQLTKSVEDRWSRELLSELGLSSTPSSSSRAWLAESLPSDWTIKPLRRLLDVIWGGDWGAERGVQECDLPCVRAADFDFANLVALEGATRSFQATNLRSRLLRAGDLVIEKSGGGEGVPVGRVVAWKGDGPAVPTNFAGGMRAADDADATFVLLAFRAAYEVGLPWRSIKQTTGLQNLDVGHYLSHPWPVPPREAQSNLAARLMARLAAVRSLQQRLGQQVELLREHRQALITAAVTGELAVPRVAT